MTSRSSFSTLSAVLTIGVILLAMAVIAAIEMVLPLHARGRSHRAHLGPNLALTFITFATNVLLNGALLSLMVLLQGRGFGILHWARLDPVVAGIAGFVALDFSFYVAHVAMHKIPAFWKVHRVHHSNPVVDVTTTIRQHPAEGLIRYGFMAAFACALGVGLGAFTVYRVWSALNGLLEHANLRVPRWFDRVLSLVTTSPNTHKVHHSRDIRETNTNYGNIFSWFDRLFFTYTPSLRGETVVCGLDGFDDPAMQTTAGLLAMPFKGRALKCRSRLEVAKVPGPVGRVAPPSSVRHPGCVSAIFLAAIERNRRRVWALCYRMTGNRADADDLAQEALAKAIERSAQTSAEDPTGWLLRLTSRVCLDHLRHAKLRRRLTELVDPLDEPEWTVDPERPSAENALVLQEDVRFAIVVALQRLSGRQRAALILRDVCGQSLAEIASALESNENAVKALLMRARASLYEARGRNDVDVCADVDVVERFARAVQAGSIEQISELLAADVWGIVDGGGIVVTANKPTYGRRTVSQQWANARAKLGLPVVAQVRWLNGEAAIVVRLAIPPQVVVAVVHLETRGGRVLSQRVIRDPRRLVRFSDATASA